MLLTAIKTLFICAGLFSSGIKGFTFYLSSQVVEGQDLVFNCTVPMVDGRISVVNLVRATTPSSVPVYANDNCTIFSTQDNNKYRGRCDWHTGSASVNFAVLSASRVADSITWKCSYRGTAVSVVIARQDFDVPVTSVTFQSLPNLMNGQSTNLVCVTSASKPQPNVTWFYRTTGGAADQELTGATVTTSVSDFLITVTSTLTRQMTKTDTGNSMYCKANNGFTERTSQIQTLDIGYPPEIHLEPNYNPYKVITGHTLQLMCVVDDANPAINSYTWSCAGQNIGTGSSYSKQVDKTDSGQHTCTASNANYLMPGLATTMVQVLYPPEVSIPATYAVIKGNRLQISCDVDANPSPSSVIWTKGGSPASQTGYSLDISNIQKSQRGQYVCTARNSMTDSGGLTQQGQNSGTVTVNVLYKPTVTVSSTFTVVEFTTLQITCTSDANPLVSPNNYRWTGPGGYTSTGPTLQINNIDRNKRGDYTCTATNTLTPTGGSSQQGTGTGQVNVVVHYMDESVFTVDKANVTENETVTMRCKVESRPIVKTSLANKDNGTILSDEITNDKTFVIQRADCLDGATYVCNSTNQEIPRTFIKSQRIIVRCSPRVDYRRELVFEFAKNISETVEFVASVIAYPKPKFSWYQLGENNNLEKIPETTIHEQIDDGLTTTLRINLTSDNDYGKYALKVVNSEGEKQLEFSLTATSKPSPPESLKIQNKTTESVQLSWISGFNGGSAQTFHIIFTTKLVDSYENWNKWNKNIKDPGRGKRAYENVTGLTSMTEYKFAVFSTNSFGQSDYLISEAVTTKEIPKVSAVNFPAAAVGGGIGAALVVILIVVLVYIFVLKKRRLHCKPSNKKKAAKNEAYGGVEASYDEVEFQETSIMPVEKPVMVDNNMYASGSFENKARSSSVAAAEVTFAAVNRGEKNGAKSAKEAPKPGPNNVYAQVDRSKKKDKTPDTKDDVRNLYAQPQKDKKKEDKKKEKKKKDKDDKKAKKNLKKDDKIPLKSKTKPGRDNVYENAEIRQKTGTESDNAYANAAFTSDENPDSVYQNAGDKHQGATGQNEDGLLYVDLDFGSSKPSSRVHHEEESTEYAAIDFTKKAPPPEPEPEPKPETKPKPKPEPKPENPDQENGV